MTIPACKFQLNPTEVSGDHVFQALMIAISSMIKVITVENISSLNITVGGLTG